MPTLRGGCGMTPPPIAVARISLRRDVVHHYHKVIVLNSDGRVKGVRPRRGFDHGRGPDNPIEIGR